MAGVKISKQILEQMEYFSKVDATAEDSDQPNRKNLVFALQEESMSSASIGAGFSSVESIVGFVEVKMKNFDLFNPPTFTGAGQKLQLIASLGSLYQDYEINFIEPYLMGRKLILGVSLFHRQVDYDSLNGMYEETYDGGALSLTKGLGPFLKGSVSYTPRTSTSASSRASAPTPPPGRISPPTFTTSMAATSRTNSALTWITTPAATCAILIGASTSSC